MNATIHFVRVSNFGLCSHHCMSRLSTLSSIGKKVGPSVNVALLVIVVVHFWVMPSALYPFLWAFLFIV